MFVFIIYNYIYSCVKYIEAVIFSKIDLVACSRSFCVQSLSVSIFNINSKIFCLKAWICCRWIVCVFRFLGCRCFTCARSDMNWNDDFMIFRVLFEVHLMLYSRFNDSNPLLLYQDFRMATKTKFSILLWKAFTKKIPKETRCAKLF